MSKNLEFIQVTLKSRQLLNTSPFLRGFLAVIVVGVFLLIGIHQPTYAQRISPGDAWQPVYQQLPDLPRENQYVSKETGKVAENNTLVSRMIRYHIYVKGRAPNYRLDWKLTLADYLGANEVMYETSYPGNDTLRKNPFDSDRAAIARLNRRQRDALVQAIVNVFSPNSQNTQVPTPNNSNQSEETTPTSRQVPKPGNL
ncbi:hypothetical protein [Mastigocladopsis repens]|uniref:hypothetical protein n=1 Tax=Mastigocladopsis repens TaxID=221287 RepID=UPI0002EFF691|nr:hypothetical protein [Mastigocladopsis repens]